MMCSNLSYIWLIVIFFIGTYSQNISDISFDVATNTLKWTYELEEITPNGFRVRRQIYSSELTAADEKYEDPHKVNYKPEETQYKIKVNWTHLPSTSYKIAIQTYVYGNITNSPTEYGIPKEYEYSTHPLKPIVCLPTLEKCENTSCDLKIARIINASLILRIFVDVREKTDIKSAQGDVFKVSNCSHEFQNNKSNQTWTQYEIKKDFDNISVNIGDIRSRIGTGIKFANDSLCDYEINIIAVNYYEEKIKCSDSKSVNQTCDKASTDPPEITYSSFFVGISIGLLLFIVIAIVIVILAIKTRYYLICWYRNSPNKLAPDSESLSMVVFNSTRTLTLVKKSSGNRITLTSLRDLLHLCTESSEVLEKEYQVTVAQIKDKKLCGSEFTGKNRYNNVLPYQDTNVKLHQIDGDISSQYINASFVKGYSKEIKYIATQGPLQNTSEDFWRMIWEQEVNTIIMLTNFVENAKTKCHRYWNECGTVLFGTIKVSHEKLIEYIDYDIRDFYIICNNEAKMVTHYHFKTWPDRGIPQAHFTFTNFLLSLRSRNNITMPIAVHCSAGIGRTGVYILCDYLLDMAEKDETVDFVKALRHIRMFRMNMVQSAIQYKFAYCVINEYLMKRNVCLEANDLLQNYDAYISDTELFRIMEYIKEESYWHNILYNKLTHFGWEQNQHKERSPREPKSCEAFISLQRYPITANESYYIDALMIPNQRLTKQFIATCHPHEHTIGDFWRLVEEFETNIILSLHEIDLNNHGNVLFWPTPGKPLKAVDYIHVNFVSMEDKIGHNVITLEVNNLKKPETTRTRHVYLLDFKTWPSNGLPRVENFLKYYKDYDVISAEIGKDISIFTCRYSLLQKFNGLAATGQKHKNCISNFKREMSYGEKLKLKFFGGSQWQPNQSILETFIYPANDGTRGNGVFLSFVYILERLLHDNIFDVRGCISTIRLYRDEYLRDMEQLKFIYKCIYNFQKLKTT